VGSDPFGHPQFETQRTPMGELLFQLKYRHNTALVTSIVDLLNQRIKALPTVDVLVPCPPSKQRAVQPVLLITQELGRRFNKPVSVVLQKELGQVPAKDLEDPVERYNTLVNSVRLQDANLLRGKTVLLIDDLYDTGTTLAVATQLLKQEAQAAKVFVLTLTKTKR
jgi:predicted amidophosphoribosyltransferase